MCLANIDNEAEILERMSEVVECYKVLCYGDGRVLPMLYPPVRGLTWPEVLNTWMEATNMENIYTRTDSDIGYYAFLTIDDAKRKAKKMLVPQIVFSMFVHKRDIKQIGEWDDKLALRASRAIVRTIPLPSGIVVPKKEIARTQCAQELLKEIHNG